MSWPPLIMCQRSLSTSCNTTCPFAVILSITRVSWKQHVLLKDILSMYDLTRFKIFPWALTVASVGQRRPLWRVIMVLSLQRRQVGLTSKFIPTKQGVCVSCVFRLRKSLICLFFSNQFATAAYYRHMFSEWISPNYEKRPMEYRMQLVASRTEDKCLGYGQYLYGRKKEGPHIGHLDGRNTPQGSMPTGNSNTTS